MNAKMINLFELGAGTVGHIEGSLLQHLQGVHEILTNWGAAKPLCDAGLYHAVYGTDGFISHLLQRDERPVVIDMIGAEAEEIVYHYAACDRDYFWPQIGVVSRPLFRDRFSGKTMSLTETQLRKFCELTVANEVEIARDKPAFVVEMADELSGLFGRMRPYISNVAHRMAVDVFANKTEFTEHLAMDVRE